MKTKYKLEIGQSFKKWTVLDDKPISLTKSRSAHYLCKCSCGQTERYVCAADLVSGRSIHCNKCGQYNGLNNLSGSYIASVKKGAKERNIEYNVTIEYLYSILESQNFKCALSNIDIKLDAKYWKKDKRQNQTASLDRIDNSKGYIEGNVQWVHKDINIMKNKYEQEYFIKLCKLISENQM